MPRRYPPLTPRDVRRILKALGFAHKTTRGSHEQWEGPAGQVVTVDAGHDEFSVKLIKSMIRQARSSRREFYGASSKTAKKLH